MALIITFALRLLRKIVPLSIFYTHKVHHRPIFLMRVKFFHFKTTRLSEMTHKT